MISSILRTEKYKKWREYFQSHLEVLFLKFPVGYSFEKFCVFMFKTSSKTIPKF
jgi:hypothetical protein